MPKKLNEGEMEEFIIGRNKSQQEIETQIGRLAEKFQEHDQDQCALSGGKSFEKLRTWIYHRKNVVILRKWKFR